MSFASAAAKPREISPVIFPGEMREWLVSAFSRMRSVVGSHESNRFRSFFILANIWQFRGGASEPGNPFPKDILDAANGSPLLARLLANRGINTPEDIHAFLKLEDYQPTSAWELPDISRAVERIAKAIETRESILIYGDFDVDGITGTSVLYEALKKRLNANVSFYIPDRATEGHGLNTPALIRLTSSRSVKLVITTDTGITNFSEVSLLNGLGIDTVITDHHALPENLPPAVANVNPQRLLIDNPKHPLGPMCGAGVAYKLCELLLERFLSPPEAAMASEALLDIVAVGTVVDMVPLVRENRYLVYKGLQVLNRRKRPGFNEILEQAGVNPTAPITSETLGFTIGPRLNALGRLERADQGVELITTEDPERVRIIAAHLEFLNRKRRDLCDQTFLEAESHFLRNGGLGDNRAIILASPDWNPGIVGIVASRLIEKHHVPVFMMVVDQSKGEVRCSARSIPGFNLYDHLLTLEDYFLGFGGHAGAGGFALKLERLEAFKRDLHAICAREITDEQMQPRVDVDAKLEWSQVNPHLIALVEQLAPFGMENPSPKFVIENAYVAAQRGMGEDERHLKLVLTQTATKSAEPKLPLEGIIWNFGRGERFDVRAPYSFVVVPGLNTFNGATKVQLIIEDYMTPHAARLATQADSSSLSGRASGVTSSRGSLSASNGAVNKLSTVGTLESEVDDPTETGAQWVDHRSRESVESFVGQLMLPLQERRKVLVYHEGRKPDIPFLDETLLSGRLNLREADELIFWDLPPSAAQLQRVLDVVKPGVVHLVGGKYQSVPVVQPEQNYLKLIVQVLRRESASQTLDLEEFAAQLATTDAVVTHGLILLEKLGMLQTRLTEPGNARQLQVDVLPQNANNANITERLEFIPFQQALREVGHFRGWLLKSPLDTIKAALRLHQAAPGFASMNEASSPSPATVVLK
jgi:single-stranded-DNA-specific exonuclease RecJ